MHTQCTIDGCDGPVKVQSRGLCNRHYRRYQRHGDPTGGRPKHGSGMAFLQSIAGTQETDCIQWPFGKGRGTVHVDGRKEPAARTVCRLTHGEPPTEGRWEAAHSCLNGDNGCVNPNHIRWATHAENYADRLVQGGHQRGENHGLSKLTADAVRSIRARCADGEARAKVGADFGISRQAVNDIVWRRRWDWLT